MREFELSIILLVLLLFLFYITSGPDVPYISEFIVWIWRGISKRIVRSRSNLLATWIMTTTFDGVDICTCIVYGERIRFSPALASKFPVDTLHVATPRHARSIVERE